MNIAIGSDHGGFELKEQLVKSMKAWKWYDTEKIMCSVTDVGTHSSDSVDYPDFAHNVCKLVESNKADFGILICGTGNGINMSANSHSGIRSALCWRRDIARLARQHNNANVLALPGRVLDYPEAWECVKEFLTASFEGGRHQTRVNKIKI